MHQFVQETVNHYSYRAAREIAHRIRSESCETQKIAALKVGVSASEWTIRRSLKKIGLKEEKKRNVNQPF